MTPWLNSEVTIFIVSVHVLVMISIDEGTFFFFNNIFTRNLDGKPMGVGTIASGFMLRFFNKT